MRVQLARFDPTGPGAPASDKVVARLLHQTETVEAAGYGDLLVPFWGRHRGKFFVSDLRLMLVPDRSIFPYPFWWRPWSAFSGLTLRGVLWNARITLARKNGEGSQHSLAVETTKALAREIERVWSERRQSRFGADWADAEVLATGQMHCWACGFNPDDAMSCGACGRLLRWPGNLGEIVAAAHDPAGTLPTQFPDGQDTQRAAILGSLATFGVAATVERQEQWLTCAARLLDAMRSRRAEEPGSFGVLPVFRGIKEPEGAQKIWEMACRYPQRLAQGRPQSPDLPR